VFGRPNPKIELGTVDTNCAILLCDTYAHDVPIVYCSRSFELLTGYSEKEVIGRNCRFLQMPYAEQDMSKQEFHQIQAEERAPQRPKQEQIELMELRSSVAHKEESQVIITNYKKDGSQFRNILATIPIRWTSDSDQLRYIVGFLADLKDCSSS
jgi:PAS domain-containing protein